MGQVESMFIIYPKQLKYINFINELLDFINRHSFKSPNGIGKTWRRCPSFLSELTVAPEYKLVRIDRAAKARGISRSAFFVDSAERHIKNLGVVKTVC
jgi:hypothetical protein